jgi:site-specific DNA-methyltransferase (adenine-specific)
MDVSRANFSFVPQLVFQKSWTDAQLYKKFNLSQAEIDFIDSKIKEM